METFTHEDVVEANKEYYNIVAGKYRKYESYAYSQDRIEDVTQLLYFCASSI